MLSLRGITRDIGALAKRILCVAQVLTCAFSTLAHGASSASSATASDLEEIIVTGLRDRELKQLPQNATIITRHDIELAPSNNLIDLIAREANITLRTYTGNDKFGGVDIRGMGDTFTSNVLVLVNGRKINSADLSGADFSSIPLWQVERIEIVRGANTVRYGDGAVAGVINILTRQPRDALSAEVQVNRAAYNTQEYGINVGAGAGFASFRLSANRYDTDGYRENGDLEKEDIGIATDLELTQTLTLNIEARQHRDQYGLPGPVADMYGSSEERRASSSPNDGGETDDDQGSVELRWTPAVAHELRLLAFGRHRENYFVNGYNEDASFEDQRSLIEEKTQSLELLYAFNQGPWQWELGFTGRDSDYARYQDGMDVVGSSSRKLGDLENRSWFTAGAWETVPSLSFNFGYREDRTNLNQANLRLVPDNCQPGPPIFVPGLGPVPGPPICSGETFDTDASRDELWKNHAFEIGAVWSINTDLSVYASQADTFRNPNIDELVLADNDLGPQSGSNTEVGVRYQMTEKLYGTVSWYRMRLEDEILYDGFVNRNSEDNTKREGVELELQWQVVDRLKAWVNASFSENRFEESDTEVPLVPNKVASLGLEYAMFDALRISAVGKYVGKRYDGNDFDNDTYEELPSYQVWDFKIIYQQPHWQLSAGLNNAFDEIYAASAYSGTFYPMPERNGYVGLLLTF